MSEHVVVGPAVMGLGMNELVVVLLIGVLIFGAAKIPEIARALGKSIHEFKKGASDTGASGDAKPPDNSKDDLKDKPAT